METSAECSEEETDRSDYNDSSERENENVFDEIETEGQICVNQKEKITTNNVNKTKLICIKTSNIMTNIIRTIKFILGCELILIVVTVILAVRSRGSITPLHLPAKHFFPRFSLVTDYYDGDLNRFTDKVQTSDLSLVFYYAPWDKQCQLLQSHFMQAAKYYHEQVSFIAINCWQPGSDCRSQYKINRFPVLVLYIRNSYDVSTKAVTYEGILDSGHLIKFLSRAIRPLVHISGHVDVARLQLNHNGLVLFYHNKTTSNATKLYNNYYFTSLKSLQYDQHLSLVWGVITDPRVATSFAIDSKSLHLVVWNATVVLRGTDQLDITTTNKWVIQRFYEIVSWVNIPQRKSLSLNNVLNNGPTLVLFTPNNPYMSSSDPFTLLRSIALDYMNCDNSVRVKQLAKYLASYSLKGRSELRQAESKCRSFIQQTIQQSTFNYEDSSYCCQKNQPSFGSNPSIDIGISSSNIFKVFRLQDLGILQLVQGWITNEDDGACRQGTSRAVPCHNSYHKCVCNNTNVSSQPSYQHSFVSHAQETLQPPLSGGPLPDNLVQELLERTVEEDCMKLLYALDLNHPPLLKDSQVNINISGLGCATNKSLNIIGIDSLHHQDLAERVGVNLSHSQDVVKTAAVIVDSKQEVHYIMKEPLSHQSLVTFIYNYTHGLLYREYISSRKQWHEDCNTDDVCIKDVNLEEYLTLIEQQGQIVIAVHRSNNCGACTSVSHTMLSVVRLMKHVKNITFVYIDVTTNTLPWHLDFYSLPTIIFHPPYFKTETRIFDRDLPLTSRNLMAFIIGNLDYESRFSVALSSCRGDCPLKLLEAATLAEKSYKKSLSSTIELLNSKSKKHKEHPSPAAKSKNNNKEEFNLIVSKKTSLERRVEKIKKRLEHLGRVHHDVQQLKPLTDLSSSTLTADGSISNSTATIV